MTAPWYVLHFARETEHIEGRKSACALKLRSHTGHVASFWIAGFHESNGYLGWSSSPAFFGFSSFSLDVYYIDSSLREPRFVLVLLRFASEAWPRAPRMPTNLLQIASSWPLKQGRKKCSKHGSSLYRSKRPHPRANTSVQERKAPEQHPQHGVEGRAPHRAEAFVAMRKSEDRSLAVTTLHTTRHNNRAVARYNQIPGGRDQQKTDWTRKPQGTNRGGGQDKGGTLQGGTEPIRSNPKQNKKNTQNNRGKHKQHPPKAKSHTQHHRTITGKRPNQTTTDVPGTGRAGRLTEQAD